MREQGFSFAGTRAALIALISRLPGNMPADLGYSTLVGRWAGQRCLVVGDYAEDDDIPDWSGPPVGALYGAANEEPQRHHFNWHKSTEAQEENYSKALREWKHTMKVIQGPYTNISEEMSGLLESACSIRFCVTDGWREYVSVKALAVKGNDEKARYELDFRGTAKERAEYVAFLHRMTGTTTEWWTRAPRDGAHHNFRDKDIDLGQRRVVASLTDRTYIDPEVFGEVPTTAAMMRGDRDGSVATALFFMLCHASSRGGGDLRLGVFPSQGIWHGHRIIATAEGEDGSGQFPTTAEVRASFTNISDEVLKQATEARATDWEGKPHEAAAE